MDLRSYYRKLRETEKKISEEFVVVKSLVTPEGGIAGRLTEVRRELAAKMLVDGLGELAGKEEAEAFRKKAAEEQKEEEQKRASTKIQFTVLTEAELRALFIVSGVRLERLEGGNGAAALLTAQVTKAEGAKCPR
ncbi:MAG: hypothetical protein HY236_04795, partial [Acidobacteria bacterium]|nr:hypothetical protein [Acidobacteriota bacterium]